MLSDESLELLLRVDLQTLGVERARETRRIRTIIDAWDLLGSEAHDLEVRVATIIGVEVVEITTSSTNDQHTFLPLAVASAFLLLLGFLLSLALASLLDVLSFAIAHG
jgi:hypothetical protein